MGMKKRLIALICTLFLLLALLPSAAGAETMYFMAVNDNMLEYSPETMPMVSGGTVYVPYTMFLSEFNGGINLGVFYGWNKQLNTLSLYSQTKPVLTFDIGAGTSYDTMDNVYSFKAILRNGTIYLPVWWVCSYFDLQYSYLPNSFGVLIRVKREESYYLTDRNFVSSATDKFREQKKQFDRIQAPAPTPTLMPPPTPTPSPDQALRGQVRVSLAFRCETGEGPQALLDVLERYQAKGLFFFRPDELVQWDDQIRRLLAGGHRVGVLVDGKTWSDCEDQAAQANRLLSRIARTRTDFLLVDGSRPLKQELVARGWVCWWENINGLPQEGSRLNGHAASLLLNIQTKRSLARITMDDSALCAGVLDRLLPRLGGGDYLFPAITEIQ